MVPLTLPPTILHHPKPPPCLAPHPVHMAPHMAAAEAAAAAAVKVDRLPGEGLIPAVPRRMVPVTVQRRKQVVGGVAAEDEGDDDWVPNSVEEAAALARQTSQRHPHDRRRGPCVHCNVTETPQWRDGPHGLKTACNACGIKWTRGNLPGYNKPDGGKKEGGKKVPSKKRAREEVSDGETEYSPVHSDVTESDSDGKGLKRRRTRTPAYLKDEYVMPISDPAERCSPDPVRKRRVRRVVVKHEEVTCVAPAASPIVQYTEAGKVVVPFGSSGDPRQRVWFGLKTEIVSAM
eukprot:jgi/Astpho2/2858/Aster-x0135